MEVKTSLSPQRRERERERRAVSWNIHTTSPTPLPALPSDPTGDFLMRRRWGVLAVQFTRARGGSVVLCLWRDSCTSGGWGRVWVSVFALNLVRLAPNGTLNMWLFKIRGHQNLPKLIFKNLTLKFSHLGLVWPNFSPAVTYLVNLVRCLAYSVTWEWGDRRNIHLLIPCDGRVKQCQWSMCVVSCVRSWSAVDCGFTIKWLESVDSVIYC